MYKNIKGVGSILKKNIKTIIAIIFILSIGFVASHLTPNLAIKTNLLVNCNFSESFTSGTELNSLQNKLDKDTLDRENSKIYNLTNTSSKNSLFNYKVKKVGFLYFASEYGEA